MLMTILGVRPDPKPGESDGKLDEIHSLQKAGFSFRGDGDLRGEGLFHHLRQRQNYVGVVLMLPTILSALGCEGDSSSDL